MKDFRQQAEELKPFAWVVEGKRRTKFDVDLVTLVRHEDDLSAATDSCDSVTPLFTRDQLDAAHAAGRLEGLEEAAKIVDEGQRTPVGMKIRAAKWEKE